MLAVAAKPTAAQVMSIGGMLVAPCVGGFLAQLSTWRTSFFVLAALWGALATHLGRGSLWTASFPKSSLELGPKPTLIPVRDAAPARYAWAVMVESCPDEQCESYLKDLSRVLDPQLLCLLLTQSCIMGATGLYDVGCSPEVFCLMRILVLPKLPTCTVWTLPHKCN